MRKKKKDDMLKEKKVFNTEGLYRFLIFFVSFLIIVFIMVYDPQGSEWKVDENVGEPAAKDIYAPFDFTFIDEARTEWARQDAMNQIDSVFRINESINSVVLNNLDKFFTGITTLRDSETQEVISDSIRDILSEVSIKELISTPEWDSFKDAVRIFTTSLLNDGLIDFSQKVKLLNENKHEIVVVGPEGEKSFSVLAMKSLSEARDEVQKTAMDTFPRDRKLRAAFAEIVTHFLRANIIFDAAETQLRQEKAAKETLPIEVQVKKNEVVLRRGRIITKGELVRLQEIEKKIQKKKVVLGIVGVGMLVFFLMLVLAGYLFHFERKIFCSLGDVFLINTALIFNLILNKTLLYFASFVNEAVIVAAGNKFLLPTSLAALLIAILIKPRLGFMIGLGMAVLSGIMMGFDPLIMLTTLFASLCGVYLMIDVRRRSQFFIVGALIGIVNFFIIGAFYIFHEMTVREAFVLAQSGLWNGLIVTVLLFPCPYIFEKLFDKTTSISLLELSDLNHPLLKRLIIEAPGTYHHSLVVSNLAESACEAVGANALLARVGAYFHDIGKIEKAEYFTENQTSKDRNFHDNLSPRMSYFIIMNHVKDGIALATSRKYNLKKVIVDFIQQHHGTSVVYFFYKKALDDLKDNEQLDKSDFRYPGPKPQTKEIAITFLADSVEAASRTLTDPTPASLRGLVDKVVNDRFLDNQLDECELTLHDLNNIKESFVRNLMAIFHTRVEYPELLNESIKGKKLKS